MIVRDAKMRFRRLQERLGDPLLTVLTILLALLLFIIAPLHAAGIVLSQDVGLAVAFVVIVTVLFAYGISAAVVVMLLGFGAALAATVLRHRHQTPLDLYLDATAWILLGLALSWVVARAVFAPGRITYHRIMGAIILLYLTIGVTFVALYTFVGLLIPDSFSGMALKDSRYICQHNGLFQLWHADDRWIRRHFAFAPDSAQPHQCGGNDRPALSSNIVGADRDACPQIENEKKL